MQEFTLTGGARIGMVKASFPFVKLVVNKHKLELNASIIGKYTFSPKDIISIKIYKQFPIISQGIKITHRVENYNKNIIFFSFKSPKDVIYKIKNTGFLNNINPTISKEDEAIIAKQYIFPLKKSFVAGAIALWNILVIIGAIETINGSSKENISIGYGFFIALGSILVGSFFMLFSTSFQKIIIKEGTTIDSLKPTIRLAIFVSSIMLLMVSFMSRLT